MTIQCPACDKCDLLNELYQNTKITSRDYYVMTELFVMLHDGDVCETVQQKNVNVQKGLNG